MITETLSKELNIQKWQVKATIDLIDDGNTIPFIARYRKELTGSLDDKTLRLFDTRLKYLRNLEDKKQQVIKSISNQNKLTEDLKIAIKNASTLVEVDDIYRPFKTKKSTRGSIAKEKGLTLLAEEIFKQELTVPVEKIAINFLSDEHGILTVEDAISGAKDIISEIISDNHDFRKYIRNFTYNNGFLEVKSKNKVDKDILSKYEMYSNYREAISNIKPHRILAINRGESEKILKVKIVGVEDDIIKYINYNVLIPITNIEIAELIDGKRYNKYTTLIIKEAILDAYKRLIAPSIEREIRGFLKEKAEDKSIEVFSRNLEDLLMQSPITGKVVLGWDPAFRTGCKIAVVDKIGNVLDTTIVYPTEPQNKIEETKKTILGLINKHDVDLISLGNGTASRESEIIISNTIKETKVNYVITNEAGASVYSASELANEEFPNLEPGLRSAVSIARRLQDPLAELVKIEPKSIGVGQYQHDMNQKKLNETLKTVVEKTVNNVGVDLNTASVSLLKFVSGLSIAISKKIIKYKQENGLFNSREELLNVPGLGAKTYKQCAGFLKVFNSNNPLDTTTVHPESYKIAIKFLNILNKDLNDLGNINFSLNSIDIKELATKLNVGEITLKDIVNELKKPGRDPRDTTPQPILRKDALTIEDLKEDMILEGTVRNVVDFGAFVDIGIHQDALVHISQLIENKFVKHPLDIVNVGDIVKVKVIDVDIPKKRVQLSMIL
ncbi:MAG: RNA-binding transcriptional accessory protein [Methanobrevibacter sp.]|jgi:uncharacterized protein|nr:RNA-binding transcriptional accessory protein [Candidatus Methanoflexus mossambicus]